MLNDHERTPSPPHGERLRVSELMELVGKADRVLSGVLDADSPTELPADELGDLLARLRDAVDEDAG